MDKTHKFRPACGRDARATGSAVIEMVLVVPILGVFFALVFFFGWVMMHKQQVVVADRYAVWQRIDTGVWPSKDHVNATSFQNRAIDVNLDHWPSGSPPADNLVAQATDRSPQAGDFSTRLIGGDSGVFPSGRTADVKADFQAGRSFVQFLERQMNQPSGGGAQYMGHHHSREGISWRRNEVNPWNTLRDVFYQDFDNALQQQQSTPAAQMAQMIRNLYLASW